MSNEQDTVIQLKKRAEEERVKLDALVERFITEAPKVAADIAEKIVQQSVQASAYVVEKLGAQLQEIKQGVQGAIARMPATCRLFVGDPQKWPHRGSSMNVSSEVGIGPSFLETAFYKTVGNVVEVLTESGLSVPRETPFAFLPGHTRSYQPLPDSVGRIVSDYRGRMKDLMNVLVELSGEQDKIARQRAKDLWDNA
jgi:hypothetical protein